MKSLVFKELWILSKAEKAATHLSFREGVNLLTGVNDVGKSTLIKSLYHCLGADTPQLNNTVWKRASPIYCVKFELAGEVYHVVRDEKYFGVFDRDKKLVSRHVGIGGELGIANFINKLLEFDIELERQANGKLGVAGPAFYFLPFYIDQDEGWHASWSSFVGLQQFSSYRRLMLDYHLGVRPQSYYDAKKSEILLQEQLNVVQTERITLQAARTSIENRKIRTRVDLDPAAFKAELESLVDSYNVVYSQQQSILTRLKEIRNQRNSIDTEIDLIKNAIRELDADYRFSSSADAPEKMGCPTCGTEFCNSFVERFGILDDIDHCHGLVDQWMKKRREISMDLQRIEGEYENVSRQLVDVEGHLARTKENVTLSELIASEGMKEMVSTLNADIQEILKSEELLTLKMSNLSELLKVDKDRKVSIVEWYKARMKEYLNLLNVGVLAEGDYDKPDKQIKNNALGSDLPRALLAQYYAFLNTMHQFNNFVICPMLVDSPFQQEQDTVNQRAIIDFLVSKRIPGQQLILATLSIDDFADNHSVSGASQQILSTKLSVLSPEKYVDVISEIGDMHGLTLSQT